MLTLLNISNVALIDQQRVDFEPGLNLLTGETGSGKSIIVDALGVLIGGRFDSDLLKSGAERASIEGLFVVTDNAELDAVLRAAGIDLGEAAEAGYEIVIRREFSANGRNKIFINHQLVTQTLLRELRPYLVDIHGQGDQQTLFDTNTHLELLDSFAGVSDMRREVADAYFAWNKLLNELKALRQDEAEKFQLVDVLKFQIDELERGQLALDEDVSLEEERRRLQNIEKLTELASESYRLIYEDDLAAVSRLRLAEKQIEELGQYESAFREYKEPLESARATLEDLSFSLRDFSEKLEFSPVRLGEIEDRLAEISRLKRKYGGSIESALEHLARSEDRLRQIEHSDEHEAELVEQLADTRALYLKRAQRLRQARVKAAKKFQQAVEQGLAEVAMENAKFKIEFDASQAGSSSHPDDLNFTAKGTDSIEFYFSANVGEATKPLARVASGGEASRLMLVLKTVGSASEFPRTIVFDEVDSGIGGRVSEAVGLKLKKLATTNQVLCVTHQPQIARFADNHLLIHKEVLAGRTGIEVNKLDRRGRVEEIARMLTGAEITESARKHARELIRS
ncbi:MAG TPA: DNA repair protein RecN [Pyrinomonadaceae bacterium]|nr:DNA repair protein RecN [Pyrinomonadaceae bacterium]